MILYPPWRLNGSNSTKGHVSSNKSLKLSEIMKLTLHLHQKEGLSCIWIVNRLLEWLENINILVIHEFYSIKVTKQKRAKAIVQYLQHFFEFCIIALKGKMKVRGLKGLNDRLIFAPRLLQSPNRLSVHDFFEQQQLGTQSRVISTSL